MTVSEGVLANAVYDDGRQGDFCDRGYNPG